MKISYALFILALFEAAQWAAATSPNHNAVTKMHLAQDVQLYAQAVPASVLDPSEALPPSAAPEAEFVDATQQGHDMVTVPTSDSLDPGCVSCGHLLVHPNTRTADTSDKSSEQEGDDEGDGDSPSMPRRSTIPTSTSAAQAAGTVEARSQTIPSRAGSRSTTETGSDLSKEGQSYSLIIVSCFCLAILFALISHQIARYRDSKEEIHNDLEMALKDGVVFPPPRSCATKTPRGRSASAPPSFGALSPTEATRHCYKCGEEISAEDDAYLAFDSYFCSTQCRGDAVATNLGGRLPRCATNKSLNEYIDICREEW